MVVAVNALLAATLAAAPASAATAITAPAGSALEALLTRDFTADMYDHVAIRADLAQTQYTGKGVTVAVIDTGVDMDHPELAGRIVSPGTAKATALGTEAGFTDFRVEPGPVADGHGHGTHTAGIIGAAADGRGTSGVAPAANIMPISIFKPGVKLEMTSEQMTLYAAAVKYAVKNGAKVINMSLGTQSFEESSGSFNNPNDDLKLAEKIMCDAITDAVDAGTVVVASAGNEGGDDNWRNLPSVCPDAISVSALNQRLQKTSWSSFDSSVDLAAPGENIASLRPTKFDGAAYPYTTMSGTSMAAPIVAGVAALVWQAHPGWTARQVIAALESTATDIEFTGVDNETGHGLVDAAAATGVAAKRTSVDASPALDPTYRGASNADPYSKLLLWHAPAAKTLPDHYTIEMYDSVTGELVDTRTAAGNEIRQEIQVPLDHNYWVALTAVYADGSKVRALPGLTGSHEEGIPGVSKITAKRITTSTLDSNGNKIVKVAVAWADVPDIADYLQVRIDGNGGYAMSQEFLADSGNGLPRKVTLTMAGVDVLNTDLDVSVIVMRRGTGASDTQTVRILSKAGFAVYGVDAVGGKKTVEVMPQKVFLTRYCPVKKGTDAYATVSDCDETKVKAQIRFRVKKGSTYGAWQTKTGALVTSDGSVRLTLPVSGTATVQIVTTPVYDGKVLTAYASKPLTIKNK